MAVILMLTLFIAAPSLDRIACSGEQTAASADGALGDAPEPHSHDDGGGKPHCEFCHLAAHWVTPDLAAAREPVSVAYRQRSWAVTSDTAWPGFRPERPPRA